MTSILFLVFAAIGFTCGYFYRSLSDQVEELRKKLNVKEAKPTVTMGAYTPPKGISNVSEAKIGLVNAKTPQRLEWESQQKLEREIKTGVTL